MSDIPLPPASLRPDAARRFRAPTDEAHAARLGLLHELLGRCGQGLAVELKLASALRSASVRDVEGSGGEPPWELAD